jgi:hypothetical protein
MTARKQTDAAAPADVSRETADVSRETSNTEGPGPRLPSLGGDVIYRLSRGDVTEINRRRRHFKDSPPATWGYQAHVGNDVHVGEVYAATIVRIFDPTSSTVNLQVTLDGADTYWATSRPNGLDDGQWSWPDQA